jgi:hypothetical protein
MNINKRIFFYPIIASHYSAFRELFYQLNQDQYDIYIIRESTLEDISSKEEKSWKDVQINILTKSELFSLKLSPSDVVVVGNDSEPRVVEILDYFHMSSAKSVMMQDGWLMSQNILRPIYRTPNFKMKVRRWVHFVLVRYTSFGKKRFHNFLGQNAKYFFVYSTYSRDQLVKAGVCESKVVVTGSPKHKGLRNIEMPMEPKVWVLFTTISYEDSDSKAMRDTILYLSQLSGCRQLLVKLHPDEDFAKYRDLNNEKVSIIKSDFNSLFTQYKVEFAFCFASTIVLDMLSMKIPVLQLAPDGMMDRYANYFLDLPLGIHFHEVQSEMEKYAMPEVTRIGEKYLLDLSTQCDSVKNVVNEIMKLK